MSALGIGLVALGGVIVIVIVWNVFRFGVPKKHTPESENKTGYG